MLYPYRDDLWQDCKRVSLARYLFLCFVCLFLSFFLFFLLGTREGKIWKLKMCDYKWPSVQIGRRVTKYLSWTKNTTRLYFLQWRYAECQKFILLISPSWIPILPVTIFCIGQLFVPFISHSSFTYSVIHYP